LGCHRIPLLQEIAVYVDSFPSAPCEFPVATSSLLTSICVAAAQQMVIFCFTRSHAATQWIAIGHGSNPVDACVVDIAVRQESAARRY
jgi:hypothetical protein